MAKDVLGGKRGNNERLPNYTKAKIFKSKIVDYVLATEKGKPFESLGYDRKNYKKLEKEIKSQLKANGVASKRQNKVGNYNYRVDMTINGLNGKTLDIKTIWEVTNKATTLVSLMKRG